MGLKSASIKLSLIFYIVFLISSTFSFAGPSTTIVISEEAYQVSDNKFDSDDIKIKEARNKFTDIKDRKFYMISHEKNDPIFIHLIFENVIMTSHKWRDAETYSSNLKSYQERFPGVLRDHLEEVLSRYPHEIVNKENAQIVTIQKGIEFWIDLINHQDLERRAAGLIFLSRHFTEEYFGLAGSLAKALTDQYLRLTRIIKEDTFTESEWKSIVSLIQTRNYSISKHGKYLLIGSGQSFFLTNEIFNEADRLNDPLQLERFQRIADFLAAKGVNIDIGEHQGAAAYFSPNANKIAYVMPSRGDLDTFTHEGTHARFQSFLDTLEKWIEKKSFAIPYEIDGPKFSFLSDFGGYMNLLNELNSWRVGTSFSNLMSDQEILKKLKDSYGRQAGQAAAKTFEQLWPLSRVNKKTVPSLILGSIKSLNSMSKNELLDYGLMAMNEKNEIKQISYLRRVNLRYNSSKIPQSIRRIVFDLQKVGETKEVQDFASRILEASLKVVESSMHSTMEQYKSYIEYSKKAKEWIETLKNEKIRVIPLDYGYELNLMLFFAAKTNAKDYSSLISELIIKFGNDKLISNEDGRNIFETILKVEGGSFEAKLMSHLNSLNEKGFDFLWSEFLKKPSYDIKNLLIEHHLEKFTVQHIQDLISINLDKQQSSSHQNYALGLLENIFEYLDFSVIYEEFEYSDVNQMQMADNKRKNRPLDTQLKFKRIPKKDHWLFDSETDILLASKMFDGKPGIYRLPMVNFVSKYTYPEELPILRDKIIRIVTADGASLNDNNYWVARIFLVPQENNFFETHIAWGEAVAKAILDDETPNVTALEFVSEFYRLAVSKTLPDSALFLLSKYQLDRRVRIKVRGEMRKASLYQKKLLKRSGYILWQLLGHEDTKVRRAARYAIASHPAFLLEVQDKILQSLKAKRSKFRFEALQLISLTKPGFLYKVDRYIESESFKLKSGESEFLELRQSPEEWFSKQKFESNGASLSLCEKSLVH
ncbi:MAG: hypothetical protein H6625_08895 [Bdellovibrionaceae bacterium]|nr:hypothetical protein [Pseudobdellovibrionaceae bacterium]